MAKSQSKTDKIGHMRVTQHVMPNGKLHLSVTNTRIYGRCMQFWYEVA